MNSKMLQFVHGEMETERQLQADLEQLELDNMYDEDELENLQMVLAQIREEEDKSVSYGIQDAWSWSSIDAEYRAQLHYLDELEDEYGEYDSSLCIPDLFEC